MRAPIAWPRIAVAVALAAVIAWVAMVAWTIAPWPPQPQMPFDPGAWRTSPSSMPRHVLRTGPNRPRMLKDLQENWLVPGLRHDQVLLLLGEPDVGNSARHLAYGLANGRSMMQPGNVWGCLTLEFDERGALQGHWIKLD